MSAVVEEIVHPATTGETQTAVLGVPGQVNLDYAATAPCARAASDAVAEILPWYASVHRGAGLLSQRCTLAYERARQTIGDFVGARADDYVIFTRNTTDALNLLAHAVPPDTTVVTFGGEHHANLLPWQHSVRLPIPGSPGEAVRALDAALRELRRLAPDDPILVSVAGATNVTGELWPVEKLALAAHRHGARIAVDAAQRSSPLKRSPARTRLVREQSPSPPASRHGQQQGCSPAG